MQTAAAMPATDVATLPDLIPAHALAVEAVTRDARDRLEALA